MGLKLLLVIVLAGLEVFIVETVEFFKALLDLFVLSEIHHREFVQLVIPQGHELVRHSSCKHYCSADDAWRVALKLPVRFQGKVR